MSRIAGLTRAGLEADYIELLEYLFTTVLDGRNQHLTDGVQQAPGRAPRDFREFAGGVAATAAWN